MHWPIALFLFVCGPALAGPAAERMIEIDYRDQDADTAAYRTRVLVSPQFMRLDYGNDRDDFVLLDRKNQRIYNVTHENKEILAIGGGTFALTKPDPWTLRHDIRAAPLGKNTKKVKLYVNEVLCSEVTAQPGLLPDAVAALKQYRALLSQAQAAVFNAQPVDQHEYCELARHVFETSRELDFGLPLAETYQNGRTRQLEQYKWRKLEPALFVLPSAYRMTNIRDVRGGI